MRNLTPETITEAVLEQMAATPDPRLKEIMTAAVKHLHAFARETNLTPGEWIKGIEFMTQVGKMCTPDRQEFILLSDTVGLSALVNLMHDRTAIEEGTDTSLLGPFYRENAPQMALGDQIAKQQDGPEVALFGHITDVKGAPLANATVSVWQTSAHGLYDTQIEGAGHDYRGVFRTDANGNYWLRTVLPIGYSIPMDGPVGALAVAQKRHGMRPAHIHYLVNAPNCRRFRAGRLRLLRFHHGDDEGVWLEVFLRRSFDLSESHGFVLCIFGVNVGVAKAVEFIQGGGHGETPEVLAGDLFLPDDFRLGAAEFRGGQAILPQEFRFLEQLRFHLCGLVRLGAGVKSKVAGHQADKILRADVIGEAQLIPDAEEQAGAEVAASFLQQFERVTVGVFQRRPRKTDDEHGLLLIAGFGHALHR